MKFTEIRDLTKSELKKKKVELKNEMFIMKMKNSLGQIGNPLQIRFLRRDIAKLTHALTQKKI